MTVVPFSTYRENWILRNLLNLQFNNLDVRNLLLFWAHSENYLPLIIKLHNELHT